MTLTLIMDFPSLVRQDFFLIIHVFSLMLGTCENIKHPVSLVFIVKPLNNVNIHVYA